MTDAGLIENRERPRVHRALGPAAGRLDRYPLAAKLPEQRLGQDRAAAVAGAQDEDPDRVAHPDRLTG